MVICFVVLRHYFFNKNPHFVTKFFMNIGFLFNILIINITYYSILCIRHLVSDPYCILHTVHCELVWVKKKKFWNFMCWSNISKSWPQLTWLVCMQMTYRFFKISLCFCLQNLLGLINSAYVWTCTLWLRKIQIIILTKSIPYLDRGPYLFLDNKMLSLKTVSFK